MKMLLRQSIFSATRALPKLFGPIRRRYVQHGVEGGRGGLVGESLASVANGIVPVKIFCLVCVSSQEVEHVCALCSPFAQLLPNCEGASSSDHGGPSVAILLSLFLRVRSLRLDFPCNIAFWLYLLVLSRHSNPPYSGLTPLSAPCRTSSHSGPASWSNLPPIDRPRSSGPS